MPLMARLTSLEPPPRRTVAFFFALSTAPMPWSVSGTFSWGGVTLTVFEPASRLQVQGEIGPFRARVNYLLEPMGGGTRLTNAVELGSSGLLTVVAPLATTRVKSAVAANLDTLKQILEQGGQHRVG